MGCGGGGGGVEVVREALKGKLDQNPDAMTTVWLLGS